MDEDSRIFALCSIATIAALLVVGAVSHGVIRHIVQTSPLWIAVVLAVRRSQWTKWAALPCFVFWFLLMVAIWLFLLGWAHIVSGTFSPVEVAMTITVGIASFLGIARALTVRTQVRPWPAIALLVLVAVLQVAAFRISLLPQIAHR